MFESLKFKRWLRKLCTFLKLRQLENQNTYLTLFQKLIIYRYSLVGRCYNILQQNWRFRVPLFPIYNIRMEQTSQENTTICNYAVFQKCLIKDWFVNSCTLQVEPVSHFFLHCHYFTDIRKTLFNELQSVDENILNQTDNETVELPYFFMVGINLNSNRTVAY